MALLSRFIVYTIAACVAALFVGTLSEQRLISYDTRTAVFVFGALLGLLNAAVKPVLQFLALPITCLTFGLFAVVINVAMFALAAWLAAGMTITFLGAVLGAIVTSIASGVMFSLVDEYAVVSLDRWP